ncbi:MAG: hypothetical protein ACE5GW_08220 [Planctomycetota bacterium]
MSSEAQSPLTEPEEAAWESAGAPPVPERRSFFTFGRCCGCLAIVLVVGLIAMFVIVKMGMDQFIPRTPFEFQRVEYTAAQAEAVTARAQAAIEAGEEFSLTPRELSIIVQHQFDKGDGAGPGSKFRCDPVGEDHLAFKLSYEIPEDLGGILNLLSGRFVNVEAVAGLTIEDHQITSASLRSYRYGTAETQAEISEEESQELLKQLKEQSRHNPELKTTLDGIVSLRIEGGAVHLKMERKE